MCPQAHSFPEPGWVLCLLLQLAGWAVTLAAVPLWLLTFISYPPSHPTASLQSAIDIQEGERTAAVLAEPWFREHSLCLPHDWQGLQPDSAWLFSLLVPQARWGLSLLPVFVPTGSYLERRG